MPANQELLFRIDTFMGPIGVWVKGIKGACNSAQMSLLRILTCSQSLCCSNSPPTPKGRQHLAPNVVDGLLPLPFFCSCLQTSFSGSLFLPVAERTVLMVLPYLLFSSTVLLLCTLGFLVL